MELEQTPVDMSSSWAWKLDQGSSSSSTAFVSTDPLSSLSKTSAGEGASTDEIFWQDFRPARSRPSRRDRKRARLSRFDSDDGDQDDPARTITLTDEVEGSAAQFDAADAAESEEDEASGLGQTSSEGSVSGDDKDERASSSGTEVKAEEAEGNTGSSATIETKAPKRSDPTASSTHLIARAIHRHALAEGNLDHEKPVQTQDHPPPLTYKETVRLVRLIAMIFRFPKSSRRIVRRRHRSTDPTSSAASTSTSTADASTSSISTSPDTSSSIELKPKYLAPHPSSSSRRPRILARVHPDDAHPSSPAVLKLIALIPAALPSRVACVEWVVDVAVQARRDEYGNILLPNTAYQSGAERDGSVDVDGDVKKEEEERGAKVTRSMRQRLGKEVPALPFPEFWRRRSGGVKDETDVKVEESDTLTGPVSGSSNTTEAGVATSSQDPCDNAPSSSSVPSTDETPRVRVHNLSKLLAERMRDKRQAKTLLLRTHQSLRKKRSGDGEDDSAAADETAAAEEEEEEVVDAETLANTIANSARVNARAAVLAGEEDGDVTIKQEDV